MIALHKFRTDRSDAGNWNEKYRVEGAVRDDPSTYSTQPFVQTILRHLSVGARILDAGCGTGGLLRFLKQRGGDVTGIDSSAVAIETLKRPAPDIPAQVASIEQLPFPDASFDAYLAIGSWEYPPGGPGPAAREATRVLKPGGFAFIEVPQISLLRRCLYLPLKRLEYFFRKISGHQPQFAHHLFTRTELRALLEEHGFAVLKIQPHDLPEHDRHYGLWVDWPFLRGGPRYRLNAIGRFVKTLGNAVSPWTISTGMFIVARKK